MGCSSVWLERLIWDQEVAGSNPVIPILGYIQQFTNWLNKKYLKIF